ncbi:bifunctional DNA-binding transcriptional regulator/O6-methylguanine-DNA methyltransferase Ada [Roseomonas sp. 18066]|uniref:bifunctional DNA-binding transcriptional regulator/O6-methylguanine-DNA methyltransferase Ada n=1 Tax=Roseomonas sp. 18066 TaxID=2681412 RepID=UPI0013598C4F|nr:bifunctional DNA-binding transcriptional regulator/O6-methylguanine-DNA methyltransferase Ada [Roseomonas sp. 18066]
MALDATTTLRDFSSDAARWQAVQARDRAADGRFVYAVLTTGVYCRPSCPSRPKRPENLSYHATPAAAEQAGYRPCKRCRPDGPAPEAMEAAAIAQACRIIEDADEIPPLESLAAAVGLSRFHFHRRFKALTGVTPRDYAAAHRAARLRDGLETGQTVTAAYHQAGFGSNGRFYAEAEGLLGMRPGEWKDGGRDAEIRFALGECSLGSVLVAATARGICAIQLGDTPEPLLEALQSRFPKARLIGGDADFEALVARVVALVEQPAGPGAESLPLDIRGTAFQQRVWKALREIPVGRTESYAEVAARLGQPSAVRAVARACATNEIAVVIPCHRVVRTGGALAGYRWGLARKQALLEREAGR